MLFGTTGAGGAGGAALHRFGEKVTIDVVPLLHK